MFPPMRLVFLRMLASVLLVTISFHAVAPAKGMENGRGSAFSAMTVDVAVLVQSRAVEKVTIPQVEPTEPQ